MPFYYISIKFDNSTNTYTISQGSSTYKELIESEMDENSMNLIRKIEILYDCEKEIMEDELKETFKKGLITIQSSDIEDKDKYPYTETPNLTIRFDREDSKFNTIVD